jgi:hypothetical protein
VDDAETVQVEQSPPLGNELKSPGQGVAGGSTSQRGKDLGGVLEAGRNYTDGNFIHGQGCIQRDDKARKLTSHCKVSPLYETGWYRVIRAQADWTFITSLELPAKGLHHLLRKMPPRDTHNEKFDKPAAAFFLASGTALSQELQW